MRPRACASSWTMRWSAPLSRSLVLDFGGVGFMDSSGIGLILGRQRSARTLGTTLQIQHAPGQLRRVLQLAGIRCTDAPKTEE